MSSGTPSNLGEIYSSLVTITPKPTPPRYRPSRFIAHARTPDGNSVIYNSLTGHHSVISVALREDLKRLLSQSGCDGPLDALGKYLLDHKYLVSVDEDEHAAWQVRFGYEHYRRDVLELILLSSEDCNFRCVYCSQQFKRGQMLPTVQRGVINLVKSRIAHLSDLTISWFGGEPLVGWETIEILAPALQKLARDNGTRLVSDMTTNGYLLSPARAAALLAWGVRSFQITLDGTEQQHDAHRPLKEGGSTYDTILSNLLALQKSDEFYEVALRVNADNHNAPQLVDLLERLSIDFGQDERFKLRFRPVGKWGGTQDGSLPTFCGWEEENSALVQLRAKATIAGMHTESLSTELRPSGVCYAARPYSLIVGADGKLMKCTVVLDTLDDNVVGMLHEDGTLSINDARFLRWVKPHYAEDSVCKRCFFLPACQGASCPLPRIVGERPCPPLKTHIQRTLHDIYALEHNPRSLLSSDTAARIHPESDPNSQNLSDQTENRVAAD